MNRGYFCPSTKKFDLNEIKEPILKPAMAAIYLAGVVELGVLLTRPLSVTTFDLQM